MEPSTVVDDCQEEESVPAPDTLQEIAHQISSGYYLDSEDVASSESTFRKEYEAALKAYGSHSLVTLLWQERIADCLFAYDRHLDAEDCYKEVLKKREESSGVKHEYTLNTAAKLASCLCKQGKDWEAEPLQRRLQEARSESFAAKPRLSFQGQLLQGQPKTFDAVKILVITDPGQDNDDEMALMLMSELVRNGEVQPLAVVANLRPSERRAALARGTLDMLDLHSVPVGIGTDGGSTTHVDKFSKYISEGKTGVDYFTQPLEDVLKLQAVMGTAEEDTVSQKARIWDGQKLLRKTLQSADDKSVTLVCLSSIKDAADLLRNSEELFFAKIKSAVIMGGVNAWKDEENLEFLVPSDAHNNCFDFPAAEFFYKRCQELGVPLVVLSRFAAYGCPVQRKVYDLMIRCPVPNPVLCRLHRAQRDSIEDLWANVNATTDRKLPARCDRAWFCDTFCNGKGLDRTEKDSMWDLVKTFNMYDPMALLSSIPERRKFFFSPKMFEDKNGCEHCIIGVDKERDGIMPSECGQFKGEDLHDYLLTTWIRASGRPRGGSDEKRPTELDCQMLTAALEPMIEHSAEEMESLKQDVLRLLDNQWVDLKNSSLLGTWRERDRLMREIGPAMILLDWETIKRLGRIPHSAENCGISMEKAAEDAAKKGLRFFIEMFSHRWSSKFAPDDRWNSKARALVEWGKYRLSMGLRTFFWVDYTCINQGDLVPGVTMLPLYVSSCNNIVCYDTPPYEPRAWCRVERLMFSAFVAPNNEYISPDFTFDEETAERLPNNDLKPKFEGRVTVPDPAGSDTQLSYPSDAALIQDLKLLCQTHWARCWKDGLMKIVDKSLRGIPQLEFGVTELRLRKF